jgi:hypothetical protein
MRNVGATLAAALAALLSGCILDRTAGGTGVGNPTKGSVTVAMVATDTAPAGKAAAGEAASKTAATGRNPDGSFTIRDAGGTAFTIKSGYANVGRIRIALPDSLDCNDADETDCESGEVKLPGPWVSDLMTGKWIPDPGSVSIPVGSYRSLDVRLEAQDKVVAGAPDLGKHSLVIGGTFAYAGRIDRPFRIALDFDEDARFESSSGFSVDSGENAITLALDIAQWMSTADLTACLDAGSLPLDALGGFSLEKGHGCDLEQALKDAVKASGSVHEENHEGKDP